MNKNSAIEYAATLLKITNEEAVKFSHEIDGLDALYFSVPIKGGDSLIIGNNNEILYANSSVSYESHVNAYKEGKRTPKEAFEI